MVVLHISRLWGFTIILFIISMVAPHISSAAPYGSGLYGACTYNTCDAISITTSGTVSLPVTPTNSGVYTTVSDTVTVGTDNSSGYTLSFKNSDTNTSLVNANGTITASNGTQASPAALALNTWGYRVDGLASFGNGPTSAQNSAGSSSFTFAGVPANNLSAHTLKTTSTDANPAETTTVWFGVRIDDTIAAGTYTDQVTYTAVTN